MSDAMNGSVGDGVSEVGDLGKQTPSAGDVESRPEAPRVHFTGRALLSMPAQQVYALLRLRVGVFVAEQGIVCEEIDERDAHPGTHHVLAYVHPGSGPEFPWGEPDPGSPLRLVGTARVFGPVDDQHIGRVCVAKDMRSFGIGKQIMEEALGVCRERAAALDPTTQVAKVTLEAQSYVTKFYEDLGFRAVSEEFLLEGVPHVRMELEL